jgi:hypothetical protein
MFTVLVAVGIPGVSQAGGADRRRYCDGLFVLISGYSIRMFYLPARVLMLLAACVGDSTL